LALFHFPGTPIPIFPHTISLFQSQYPQVTPGTLVAISFTMDAGTIIFSVKRCANILTNTFRGGVLSWRDSSFVRKSVDKYSGHTRQGTATTAAGNGGLVKGECHEKK
jgi:hypothetical protein